MRLFKLGVVSFAAVIIAASCKTTKDTSNDIKETDTQTTMNDIDSVSYGIGVNIGRNLKSEGFDTLSVEMIAEALNDVLTGAELRLSEQECMSYVQKYMGDMREKKMQANIEKGEKFLEENGKRDGVVTLASGLQYEVLVEGTGPKPGPTDKVKTHYHGTLIDGEVFDSSVERGEPISFPVNGVIKGWTEALQLMGVGSKWKLFIPYNLAYGERGAGAKIGPYSTLVFEVELLGIE